MSDYPSIERTKPEVFILESLTLEDEENERFEGRLIRDILTLSGKFPRYYYFRTEKELIELVKEFRKSGYRFLHISAHGSHDSLLTTFDEIKYSRFAEIFKGQLRNRRLFVSACEMGNELFSTVVSAQNKGMYSIIGPTERIQFDRAAAIWVSFYILMFDLDKRFMKAEPITRQLRNLSRLFSESFHFSKYVAKQDKWVHETITGIGKGPASKDGPSKW